MVIAVLRCLPFLIPPYMAEPECTDDNVWGSTCTFSCLFGAQLVGAHSATCSMETGGMTWKYEDGQAPVCEG